MSQSPRDPRMEKFLDGLLSPQEMAATRRAIESDPELKREAELQSWIDAELDEMFAYDSSRAPVIPHADEPAEAPAPIRIETRRPQWRVWAMAASLLLVGGVVWVMIRPSVPRPVYESADAIYTKLVSRGFKPQVVCTTDDEFKQFTQNRLGAPIVLASAPGVQALGWAYSAPLPGIIVGGRTSLLYTTVDSKEVLVLMDPKDRPADHPITVQPPLHVFREQVGPVTMYEITPLNEKRVVNNLKLVQ